MESKEVLEILKASIRDYEVHKRNISEPKGELFAIGHFIIKGEENVKLIKEWLKNEEQQCIKENKKI